MDIEDALDFVAPKVRDAALKAAAQLEQLGIRHALAGGLAVGADRLPPQPDRDAAVRGR